MKFKILPKHSIGGAAFPDFIRTEKLPRKDTSFSDHLHGSVPAMRWYLMPVLIVVVAAVLFFKLVHLQVVQGFYYRRLSDSNRIRTYVLHAPRGVIFDRNGVPFVYNTPGFRQLVKGKTKLLSHDKALELLGKGNTGVEVDALREYPYKEATAHLIGYVGQITKEELANDPSNKYHIGDLVGEMGIEQQYEEKLVGTDGKKLVEVDSNGKEVRTLGQTDPVPGKDITLTLDFKLQKVAYDVLKDVQKGVIVVSTPQGEVLAMVSKPTFDPNLFTLDETYKTASDAAYTRVSNILTDGQNHPLLNRAVSGEYPPGSTFKLVTAAAALETKKINEQYEVTDNGIIKIGQFSFANWYFTQYGGTDGAVNVVKAIKRSNDIFFYKVAELVGVDLLSEYAKKFGVGSRLGIDLAGEAKGTLPTNAWKKEQIGEQWYLGDTYHYGIGQGFLLTTPLQVNAWTQAIANKGTLYKPHLYKDLQPHIINKDLLSQKASALIHQGMQQSCEEGGVGWPLFGFKVKNAKLKIDDKNIFPLQVSSSSATPSAQLVDYKHVTIACKTGTAQHGDEHTLPHAWITLFAPAENPQIVVTVLAESSGEGSSIAAPIAKKILEEWFSR